MQHILPAADCVSGGTVRTRCGCEGWGSDGVHGPHESLLCGPCMAVLGWLHVGVLQQGANVCLCVRVWLC